jgi:hypothetical protein
MFVKPSRCLLLIVCCLLTPSGSSADDLDNQRKALLLIRETAADICLTVAQQGSSESTDLSGKIIAKLGGVVGKVADLGIEGAGKYKSEEYKNVLQKDLLTLIQGNSNCRLDVFKLLQDKMLGSAKSGGLGADALDRLSLVLAKSIHIGSTQFSAKDSISGSLTVTACGGRSVTQINVCDSGCGLVYILPNGISCGVAYFGTSPNQQPPCRASNEASCISEPCVATTSVEMSEKVFLTFALPVEEKRREWFGPATFSKNSYYQSELKRMARLGPLTITLSRTKHVTRGYFGEGRMDSMGLSCSDLLTIEQTS